MNARACPPCTQNCRQGRDCPREVQTLPLTLRNLGAAVAIVAAAAALSALFPWGVL